MMEGYFLNVSKITYGIQTYDILSHRESFYHINQCTSVCIQVLELCGRQCEGVGNRRVGVGRGGMVQS